MKAYDTLRVERNGPVGWLVFDRPDVGNAMDARMMHELEDAWRELDADPDVRVIVNTGEGDVFQTGLDMAQLARDPEALREQSRRTKRFELRFTAWHNEVWKPVVAAVNGVCAGGGLHFVADADIVIASSHATFVDPHVSVGQASVYETIALAKKSPMESVLRLALVGRHERIAGCACVRARHREPGRRSARAVARGGAGARREDRPQRSRPALGDQAGAVGRARARRAVSTIGTAIVSYIEPSPGHARDFNRWYERDHFPSAVLGGPGVLGGARFVATHSCKALRPADATLFGDPARGSYLGVAFVAPGRQPEWDEWVVREMETITAEGRLFPHREHVHTAVYRCAAAHGDVLAERFAGVIAIATTRDAPTVEAPTHVLLELERTIVSSADPPPHLLVLAYCTEDPLRAFSGITLPPASVSRARSSRRSPARTPSPRSCSVRPQRGGRVQ